ncbi:MAG: S8 family serine peptidase [Clostridia bacterium]|nr:S8 family serine peptidase [Clostridia bacterium]
MKLKFIFFTLLIIILSLFCVSAFSAEGDYIVILKEEHASNAEVLSHLEPIIPEERMYLLKDSSKLDFIATFAEHIEEDLPVDVSFPDPDPMLFTAPEDASYSRQWNHTLINLPAVFNMETYGNEVRVAVIDSGCNVNHPDLKDRVLTGKSYITGTTDVTDNVGHGTHVSGIIAATMNDVGICGVAPKAKIVPLKCFDNGATTTTAMLSQAIKDAVDVYGCKVINMSWGMSYNYSSVRTALNYAFTKGAILVASSGNAENGASPDAISYPAYYTTVFSVASVTSSGTRASYSYYNDGVTVAAPGSGIYSTYKTGGYGSMSGTSQAAPHVAGLAALALSINPNLSPNDFAVILTSTCTDKGDEGYDTHYGYGLVNAEAMAEKVIDTIPLYVSPINTAYGKSAFYIENNSDTDINATSIFARYEDSGLSGVDALDISLSKGEGMRIEADFLYSKHFWWKSLQNPVPIDIE